MPVSTRAFLFAKTVPAIAIPIIPNLIASVLMIITTESGIPESILLILVPQAASVTTAFLGILLNCAFPKFDFENEVQVVKQSAAMFIAMLAATLYGLINVALAVVFSIFVGGAILAMLMMLLLSLILTGVFAYLIAGPCKRKFDKYPA